MIEYNFYFTYIRVFWLKALVLRIQVNPSEQNLDNDERTFSLEANDTSRDSGAS